MPLNDQQIQTLGRDALQRAAAGDFASAEEMFARIVEARPNMGQALHLLGQVRLKLGRFAEAREPLERAAQFLPREVSAQTNLAGCLVQLGRHEQALAALAKAARLKPDDAVIAHNTGRALEALGRAEDAERAYDRALSIDHRLLPALSARAELLAARGEWAGALADLETALVSQPNDPRLRLRRGELMLRQGDWWRGLGDYEARLEIPGERYTPDLPRWQGEPLDGRLLIYPEQADIESDAALRDTVMLARGVEATVQCGATLAGWWDGPTIRRGEPLDGFVAAAPLRSLPLLLNWTRDALPAPAKPSRKPEPSSRIGWFTVAEPPTGFARLDLVRTPEEIPTCRLVLGDDTWPAHAAAALGIPTIFLVPNTADWLWGPNLGTSPWYASAELLRDDDREGLAARLAGC
ncbi:MAG: tetratricopeptide repeat protein [Reyranella sp.]|uniref:tetratricopeptide repeat protein n=1 Tax=Reyranella sp. TaxID=1929291 RepID=UPI001217DBC3|nr:tetratricopeptide repeat protein [Reyranella sp.]TAJ92802.1 MAG: tetratricopeptide repeat protein [Reyranella sp.]